MYMCLRFPHWQWALWEPLAALSAPIQAHDKATYQSYQFQHTYSPTANSGSLCLFSVGENARDWKRGEESGSTRKYSGYSLSWKLKLVISGPQHTWICVVCYYLVYINLDGEAVRAVTCVKAILQMMERGKRTLSVIWNEEKRALLMSCLMMTCRVISISPLV